MAVGFFFLATFISLIVNIVETQRAKDEGDKQLAELEKLGRAKRHYDDETLSINNATSWPQAFNWNT